MIFQQLFEAESSTYTYLLADEQSKEAILIDPVIETIDRDIRLLEELGLKLKYVLDTHVHADHITAAGQLRERIKGVQTAVSHDAQVSCVDIPLKEGDRLTFGKYQIEVIATPGHTNTCLSYYTEGMVFTGDALLIRGCGRTDFQQGSSEKLYTSVKTKLFELPSGTKVYPGHDYRGFTSSSIEAEKKHNPRLKEGITLEQFKTVMSELKLANPKKIHEAVPANMACGVRANNPITGLQPRVIDGIPEVTVENVYTLMNKVDRGELKLIDVRMAEEFCGELGHVKGAELVTLGPALMSYLESGDRSDEIVFVCRSGGRSGAATVEAQRMGYKFVYNLAGGMIRWNELNQPVERN